VSNGAHMLIGARPAVFIRVVVRGSNPNG
jgi:hypothetical protein